MQLQVIAKIHNDFTQKFGIPRQSGLAPHMRSRIIFEPKFAVAEALRGIEGFSHLWLIWQFDRAVRGVTSGVGDECGAARECENRTESANGDSQVSSTAHTYTTWRPTVRPPRLGGNERVGVFATRSPYRPNSLGLSVVRLERAEMHTPEGPVLHVLGADIMDNTPIFDIKPYLPYADAHTEAKGGFVDKSVDKSRAPQKFLQVEIPQEVRKLIADEKIEALREVLSCDPRPAYHNDPERIYSMKFGDLDVSFKVKGDTLKVVNVV